MTCAKSKFFNSQQYFKLYFWYVVPTNDELVLLTTKWFTQKFSTNHLTIKRLYDNKIKVLHITISGDATTESDKIKF